ncbi:MAG: hypothetical protein ILA11_11260 [Butyrivibrio sp.]|nr:hypothetical protein [Butyrivibrio sp.]
MQWCGKVGFTEEIKEGVSVYRNEIVERKYFGEVLSLSHKDQSDKSINKDFTISNRISLISDPFGMRNFHKICYATLGDVKWRVDSVEVAYPRLILSLSSLYKEEAEEEEDEESAG